MLTRSLVLAVACVALTDEAVLGQGKGPGRGDAQAARFGWLSSLTEGKAKARKSGKPLMVVVRCVP